MLGYSQSQQQWEIIYTHCCIFYSEEIKYIAENSLSIGEAGWYSKKQTKKKKEKEKTSVAFFGYQTEFKFWEWNCLMRTQGAHFTLLL